MESPRLQVPSPPVSLQTEADSRLAPASSVATKTNSDKPSRLDDDMQTPPTAHRRSRRRLHRRQDKCWKTIHPPTPVRQHHATSTHVAADTNAVPPPPCNAQGSADPSLLRPPPTEERIARPAAVITVYNSHQKSPPPADRTSLAGQCTPCCCSSLPSTFLLAPPCCTRRNNVTSVYVICRSTQRPTRAACQRGSTPVLCCCCSTTEGRQTHKKTEAEGAMGGYRDDAPARLLQPSINASHPRHLLFEKCRPSDFDGVCSGARLSVKKTTAPLKTTVAPTAATDCRLRHDDWPTTRKRLLLMLPPSTTSSFNGPFDAHHLKMDITRLHLATDSTPRRFNGHLKQTRLPRLPSPRSTGVADSRKIGPPTASVAYEGTVCALTNSRDSTRSTTTSATTICTKYDYWLRDHLLATTIATIKIDYDYLELSSSTLVSTTSIRALCTVVKFIFILLY